MNSYGLVLHFVHFVCRLAAWLANCSRVFLRSRLSLLFIGGGVFDFDAVSLSAVQTRKLLRNFQSLKKIPKHFGILISEEKISCSDIANLIVWCALSGITSISVYDHQGVIKAHHKLLQECINTKQREYLAAKNFNFCLENHAGMSLKTNGHSNGIKRDVQEVEVHLLSSDESRSEIVASARKLAKDIRNNLIQITDVRVEQYEERLLGKHKLPYPDLLVIYGPTYSTLGFRPWHIYLTEILHWPTHHRIDCDAFLEALRQFNRCEQRFGK